MNKFKLHQRVVSPTFGEGVVVLEDNDDNSIMVKFKNGGEQIWYFQEYGELVNFHFDDHLTPIGPYEGERVAHAEFGAGTIVETETGFGGRLILVQFDKVNDRLHDGNGYCRGTYLAGTCWSFTPSKYGTEINPLTEPQPAPATVAEVERLIAAHVDEYHAPVKPDTAAIPEGWTAIERKPEYEYDVELLLKDGTQRYGFLNTNDRYALFAEGSKPDGVGNNCVYHTDAKRTVVPASDVLAWRHITAAPAAPAVPEGWNAGHPDDEDMNNIEIIFADGTTSVGYWGVDTLKWYEFEKEYWPKALSDKGYCGHCDTCQKPVIGWRVPQPDPEPFKRGERVVLYGEQVTFVAYENDICVIVMLDDGNESGWSADFRPGLYGSFLYTNTKNLKREAKQ